jgi:sn1-specific diacylglycerol lipase
VVSRLSLGSVKDLKNAAMWLCEEETRRSGDGVGADPNVNKAGYSGVMERAKRWKDGKGSEGDEEWVG